MKEENILYYVDNNVKSLQRNYEICLEKNIQELIIYYGIKLLKKYGKKNSIYKWNLYEEILKACIELKLYEYVDIYFKKLNDRFGHLNGKKIEILKGMVYELKDKNDEALCIYKNYIYNDPSDLLIRAKIVKLKKKVEGNINNVIQILNDHLKEFPVDVEAWHELGEIYLKNCYYTYALYCFEEILMHAPKNLYYILSCAELHYTISQYELSSKYFCLSLKLQKNNLRALWGIVLVNLSRYGNKKGKNLNDNVDVILTKKCIDRLYNLYDKNTNFLYRNIILQYLKEIGESFV
ncbi:hypothetical protein PFMG_03637 [Plasmodium falciparum IGH-CR14]|uniref:ER membrane protein complex subunit 2 n=1 Tax=Plasmodium falciparum IGH-CR14 TaxID=580059 RepID=A0A0L1IEJ6_PLAFA|nr:hypothetical protein PFMG_03637 [Plasmodium falciparum IGH-CR14]